MTPAALRTTATQFAVSRYTNCLSKPDTGCGLRRGGERPSGSYPTTTKQQLWDPFECVPLDPSLPAPLPKKEDEAAPIHPMHPEGLPLTWCEELLAFTEARSHGWRATGPTPQLPVAVSAKLWAESVLRHQVFTAHNHGSRAALTLSLTSVPNLLASGLAVLIGRFPYRQSGLVGVIRWLIECPGPEGPPAAAGHRARGCRARRPTGRRL
jgi:hypothetical protein